VRRAVAFFLWLGLLSIAWPLIHLAVAIFRFGPGFELGFVDALVFLPMGVMSGGTLLYLLGKSNSRRQQLFTVAGYVLASPIAFVAALGGGLFLPPLIGVSLFGGLPLVLGSIMGRLAGLYLDGKGSGVAL
jgi:hypothetical protein